MILLQCLNTTWSGDVAQWVQSKHYKGREKKKGKREVRRKKETNSKYSHYCVLKPTKPNNRLNSQGRKRKPKSIRRLLYGLVPSLLVCLSFFAFLPPFFPPFFFLSSFLSFLPSFCSSSNMTLAYDQLYNPYQSSFLSLPRARIAGLT